MMRRSAALLGLTAGVGLAGCYRYVPVEPGSVPPGAEVRATVTAAQAEQLREIRGDETRFVEGRWVQAGSNDVLVEIPIAERTGAVGIEVLHQRVAIPRADIIELQLRELDRLKTGAVAVGAAVVLVAGAVIAFEGGGPGDSRNPPGGPPEIRIPLRWSIGIGR